MSMSFLGVNDLRHAIPLVVTTEFSFLVVETECSILREQRCSAVTHMSPTGHAWELELHCARAKELPQIRPNHIPLLSEMSAQCPCTMGCHSRPSVRCWVCTPACSGLLSHSPWFWPALSKGPTQGQQLQPLCVIVQLREGWFRGRKNISISWSNATKAQLSWEESGVDIGDEAAMRWMEGSRAQWILAEGGEDTVALFQHPSVS